MNNMLPHASSTNTAQPGQETQVKTVKEPILQKDDINMKKIYT